jgi:hypothetical protein
MANIMAEPDKWKRLQMAHHAKVSPDEYTRIFKDIWSTYADNSQIDIVMGMAMLEELGKKMSKHELAEIGAKIINMCSVPVRRFALNVSNPDALEIALKIQGSSDWETSRKVALTQYVSNLRKIKFPEAWEFVEINYNKALAVINKKDFNHEN